MMSLRPSRAMLLAALVVAAACARPRLPDGSPRPSASGTLHDTAGTAIGVAAVTRHGDRVELSISVAGLAPGPHGLHFHEVGTCTPPAFTSAGAHFNPGRKQHGRLNPQGPHAGDLPNLIAGADGSADTSFTVSPDLLGAGPGSLLASGSAALVVHAGPDDERTDPSGGSGARVACAVLEPG